MNPRKGPPPPHPRRVLALISVRVVTGPWSPEPQESGSAVPSGTPVRTGLALRAVGALLGLGAGDTVLGTRSRAGWLPVSDHSYFIR